MSIHSHCQCLEHGPLHRKVPEGAPRRAHCTFGLRRCLGSSRAPSPTPTTLHFLRVWAGSTKRTEIGQSTRWRLWWPTSPLPYPTSRNLPPLPMPLSVLWVFPRPRLLPLRWHWHWQCVITAILMLCMYIHLHLHVLEFMTVAITKYQHDVYTIHWPARESTNGYWPTT